MKTINNLLYILSFWPFSLRLQGLALEANKALISKAKAAIYRPRTNIAAVSGVDFVNFCKRFAEWQHNKQQVLLLLLLLLLG